MNRYLTVKEERQLIRRGQKGDTDARNQVIMNSFYLINREVGKRGKVLGRQYNDCLNFVIGVLCEKFHKFELKRGLRYSTYALFWVRQSRNRFIDEMGLIHVPSFILRPSKKDTERVMRFGGFADKARSVRTIEPMPGEPYMRYQEQFVSRDQAPEFESDHQDDLQELHYLLARLDAREREIVTLRSQGIPLRIVGEKFGITKERTRQIEFHAIKKMREIALKEHGEEINTKSTRQTYHFTPASQMN